MPGLCGTATYRSAFLEAPCASYSLGRYALTAALRSLGVGPGTTVLIPAYHCRTMIDPVVRLGGNVQLFSLLPDLTPDWPQLDVCLSACGKAVALVLPHYFGFPQSIKTVQAWCKRHQVAYVEDCSHAMFGVYDGAPIGSFGDCAIASPYKFFASENGGVLRGVHPDIDASRPAPGLRAELKAVWRSWESLLQQWHRRLSVSAGDDASPCGTDAVNEDAGISRQYDPAAEDMQALRWSRLSLHFSSVGRIAVARRQNYLAWLDVASTMPGCRPLFRELPAGVVPYMFPLWLDHPERAFYRLKRAGMPIFRWDELAVSDCNVSRAARLGLIHLPCHQGVGRAELSWMTEELRRALQEQSAA
ncbi:MAG: hypothetical protein GC183_16115 [Thiobacillus sp.]|nr:hypothetical protein [Thiobacillus sp.]